MDDGKPGTIWRISSDMKSANRLVQERSFTRFSMTIVTDRYHAHATLEKFLGMNRSQARRTNRAKRRVEWANASRVNGETEETNFFRCGHAG